MSEELIAHFQITGKLGAGGMGEVFRATDTKLNREVAIKVLPESFAQDPERLARFQREAEVLASLNHPNIAAIHGLEETDGSKALILELIEGETLAERLLRGPLPVEEALEVCKAIAEALEAAHEKGIIHRDLKPGNVKFARDGKVKVLDFGLAKAMGDELTETGSVQANSPTITDNFTKPGTILGTAAYMSPEQARGKHVDRRSDIWSLGCVLFECLTGKCPFKGEDVSETLATIIKGEPNWKSLPENTPPTIQLLLRKCLNKDRQRRLHDIADARVDMEQAIADPSSSFIRLSGRALEQTSNRDRRQRLPRIGVAVLFSAIAAALTWFLKPAPKPPPARYSEILIPGPMSFTTSVGNNAFALSPAGGSLIYNLDDRGGGFYLRDLTSGRNAPIRGAADPLEGYPFFSPDGSRFGCLLGENLMTIPISGGNPRQLGDFKLSYLLFRGADWGKDGAIVFAERGQPLRLVSEEGGDGEVLTELKGEIAHAFPQFLPDGKNILFLVVVREGGLPIGHLEVFNIDTRERKKLGIENCNYARYSPSGHLLFAVADEVFAVAFDLERLEPRGKSKRVLEGVMSNSYRRSQFDVADDGTLVYLAGADWASSGEEQSLAWIDENGQTNPFTTKSGLWRRFDLSPNERRVALEIDGDIWVLDKIREDFEQLRPLVTGESRETHPLWSVDGRSIFFSSDREGKQAIWKIRADFSDKPAELIWESPSSVVSPRSTSESDLLFSQFNADARAEIWRLTFNEQEAKPEPFLLREGVDYYFPEISPDGKWLGYGSNEQGFEVFLRSMIGSTGSRLVSDGGGVRTRWSRAGDRIYYDWGTRYFSVALTERDAQLMPGKPRQILSFDGVSHNQWTVAGATDQILALVPADSVLSETETGPVTDAIAGPTHLKMISNWFTELNQIVPPRE